MRRALFVITETVVFLGTEGANALAIAPISPAARMTAGAAVAVFFALGFVVPGAQRTRTMMLVLDALLLGAIATFSELAAGVAILLPLRCLELKPRDRTALRICTAFGVCALALSCLAGGYLEHRPAAALGFVMIPIFALVLSLFALSEDLRRSRATLAATNLELALRAERWQRIATLTERYQVGRDLQREVGRGLRVIGDELEQVLSEGGTAAQTAHAFHAQRAAAFALAGLENMVSQLRADSLGQGNIAATLRDLCKTFSATATQAIAEEIADVGVTDPMIAAALERIAREALINVARHSEATHVKMAYGAAGDRVELRILDDGLGFEQSAIQPGHSLRSIRELVEILGGECAIESAPASGTVIRVTLPASTAGQA